jgi:hypothetical protein
MKTILALLFAAALGITQSFARDITIEWDLNPETDITYYRLETATNVAGPWTDAGRTASGAVPTTINFLELKGLPNTILFVRAYAANVAGLESEFPSDVLQVDPDRPGKPGKPRIKITLQSSADLKNWKDLHVVEKDAPEGDRQFFRTGLAITPG